MTYHTHRRVKQPRSRRQSSSLCVAGGSARSASHTTWTRRSAAAATWCGCEWESVLALCCGRKRRQAHAPRMLACWALKRESNTVVTVLCWCPICCRASYTMCEPCRPACMLAVHGEHIAAMRLNNRTTWLLCTQRSHV